MAFFLCFLIPFDYFYLMIVSHLFKKENKIYGVWFPQTSFTPLDVHVYPKKKLDPQLMTKLR